MNVISISFYTYPVGGFTNPFDKYARQIGSFPPNIRGENTKYLKPPTRYKATEPRLNCSSGSTKGAVLRKLSRFKRHSYFLIHQMGLLLFGILDKGDKKTALKKENLGITKNLDGL